ncbi:hypothetical protein HDU99_006888, partial [Rhizoclosmatium hyalinum]
MQNTLALIYVHWAQAQDGDQDRESTICPLKPRPCITNVSCTADADAEKSLPDVADYDRVAKMEQLES